MTNWTINAAVVAGLIMPASAKAQPVRPAPVPPGPIAVDPRGGLPPRPAGPPVATRAVLPDLVLLRVEAQPSRVVATVRNAGPGSADARAAIVLLVDGREVARDTVPALAAGGEVVVRLRFATPWHARYEVVIDPDARLTEVTTRNNRLGGVMEAGRRWPDQIEPGLAAVAGTLTDPVRPAAAARFPDGEVVRFVDDELVLSTRDPAVLAGVLARTGGTVVKTTTWPGWLDRPPLVRIRITKRATGAEQFGSGERSFSFSSAAARDLLATAMRERKLGAKVGINYLSDPASILTGSIVDGGGNDPLTEVYNRAGGPVDTDIPAAWKALAVAGRAIPGSFRIGFVDSGFAPAAAASSTWDLNVVWTNGGAPGAKIPWHGTAVAQAAAAIPDNGQGTAGPAGPVAQLVLATHNLELADSIDALSNALKQGSRIVNMSWRISTPRRTGLAGFFAGAWPGSLEDFEELTRAIADSGKVLLFAAAGNDGQNVDEVDEDGDETAWVMHRAKIRASSASAAIALHFPTSLRRSRTTASR